MITLDDFREQLTSERIHIVKLLEQVKTSLSSMEIGTLDYTNTYALMSDYKGKLAILDWIISMSFTIEVPKTKMREFL